MDETNVRIKQPFPFFYQQYNKIHSFEYLEAI